MTPWKLIRGGLFHYRRTHVPVLLGVACATAVLMGVVCVGHSVEESLRLRVESRIGRVQSALQFSERYFQDDLATRLAAGSSDVHMATVLELPGIAVVRGGDARTGIVQVLGVDREFFALAPKPRADAPLPGEAWINRRLARQLGLGPNHPLLLRIEKPGRLPRDLAFAKVEDLSIAVSVNVGAILDADDFGDFDLRSQQVPPRNVLVSRAWLQAQVGLLGRANRLFLATAPTSSQTGEDFAKRLQGVWNLADLEYHVKALEGRDQFELTSSRIFLDGAVERALASWSDGPPLTLILTYFVNALHHADRSTPYSMVSGLGFLRSERTAPGASLPLASLLPADLAEDGLVLNEWTAKDLHADMGSPVRLDYFAMDEGLGLSELTGEFRVARVVPLRGEANDPELMPEFPGLSGSARCRDWEPGIPIALDRIRDKDEEYWTNHHGTPKAFTSLARAQSLWSNRFGALTAIRGFGPDRNRVLEHLRRTLDPRELGLVFRDVKELAKRSGTSATDFSGLLMGLSFFLMFAAVLLTGLLFVLGVEQRLQDVGTLLAAGLGPRHVRHVLLGEGAVVAAAGTVLGVLLGILYARSIMWGLSTIWRDAVGSASLSLHLRWPEFLVALNGFFIAVITMFVCVRRVLRRPVVELLAAKGGVSIPRPRTGRTLLIVAALLAIAALGLVLAVGPRSDGAALVFFGAGTLVLMATVLVSGWWIGRLGSGHQQPARSVSGLGFRNAGRRRGRSLATVALLASGTFLVTSIQAHRVDAPKDPTRRNSGTGGFSLIGRTTLPVLRDLTTESGQRTFGLDPSELTGIGIVSFRVREGDDASCLNLAKAARPTLLGVDSKQLSQRGAFRILEMDSNTAPSPKAWDLLSAATEPSIVPAIGDHASIKWNLKKGLGDFLDDIDEFGRPIRIKIVATLQNSVLQGSLVIAQEQFAKHFPSLSGYRRFLVDAPMERLESIRSRLTEALADVGLELTPTTDRLFALNSVQNTYLVIFQVLGALGLLLGSVGLGLVLLRNTLDRRSELACARALGFSNRQLRRLLGSEHLLLLALGTSSGVVAALCALIPSVAANPSTAPLGPVLLCAALISLSGWIWVLLATYLATRGNLLDSLQGT